MEIQTPCKQDGCHAYAKIRGYCRKHERPVFKSRRLERLPEDWNTRRDYVLRRDKLICYVCKQKGADAVDHIKPGDDHSYENLAAIHHNVKPFCHRKKTSREGLARQGLEAKDHTPKKEIEEIDWGFD